MVNQPRSTIIWQILILYECINLIGSNQYVESPCPEIFQYQVDDAGRRFGSIQVKAPEADEIQITVELTFVNIVDDYKASIALVSKNTVLQNIKNGKPINYKIDWNGIPPMISKIMVNGKLICRGSKVPYQIRSIVTVLHTLKLPFIPQRHSSSEDFSSEIDPERIPFNPNFDHRDSFNYNLSPPKRQTHPKGAFFGNPFFNGDISLEKNPTQSTIPITTTTKERTTEPSIHKSTNKPSNIFLNNPFFNGDITISRTTINNISTFLGANNLQNDSLRPKQEVTERPNVITTQPNVTPSRVTTHTVLDLPPRLHFSEICGISAATSTLVVSGDDVPLGAYPWLVAMYEVKAIGLKYKCCGVLISTKHVVTAAHCVDKHNPGDIFLRLGKQNIGDWKLTPDEVMIVAKTIDVHTDYQPGIADADIAVITINTQVTFTRTIRPLCLWSGSNDLSLVVGLEGTVVGWGKDENGADNTAEPKQTKLPIVSQEQCLRSAYQFRDITSNRTFCAGTQNGNGPCNGDSGSGLIVQKNGRWVLRGIVSMSIYDPEIRSCDLKNYVVFTDASKFTNWLRSFIIQ